MALVDSWCRRKYYMSHLAWMKVGQDWTFIRMWIFAEAWVTSIILHIYTICLYTNNVIRWNGCGCHLTHLTDKPANGSLVKQWHHSICKFIVSVLCLSSSHLCLLVSALPLACVPLYGLNWHPLVVLALRTKAVLSGWCSGVHGNPSHSILLIVNPRSGLIRLGGLLSVNQQCCSPCHCGRQPGNQIVALLAST